MVDHVKILAYPRYGADAPRFVLDADACGYGLGAVLSQAGDDGVERPIAYASRLLSSTERHYASTEGELLGIVWAFRHFRCYLLGKRFLVRAYHRALELLDKFKEPSAIIARWLEFLSQFEYDLQYRQGRTNANADALSHLPVEQETRAEAVVNAVEVVKLPVPFVQRRNWSFASWVESPEQR